MIWSFGYTVGSADIRQAALTLNCFIYDSSEVEKANIIYSVKHEVLHSPDVHLPSNVHHEWAIWLLNWPQEF